MKLPPNAKTLALRFAVLAATCVWVGGFTFYGGIVVPILDAELGHFDAGQITRKVTNGLNLVGLGTLLAWWVLVGVERLDHSRRLGLLRIVILLSTTLMLAWLAQVHLAMDHHLDSQGLVGFKPWHRLYLKISTAQWLANLAMLAVSVVFWDAGTASDLVFPTNLKTNGRDRLE